MSANQRKLLRGEVVQFTSYCSDTGKHDSELKGLIGWVVGSYNDFGETFYQIEGPMDELLEAFGTGPQRSAEVMADFAADHDSSLYHLMDIARESLRPIRQLQVRTQSQYGRD